MRLRALFASISPFWRMYLIAAINAAVPFVVVCGVVEDARLLSLFQSGDQSFRLGMYLGFVCFYSLQHWLGGDV